MMGLRSFLRFFPLPLLLLPVDPEAPLEDPVACLILVDARFLILVPFIALYLAQGGDGLSSQTSGIEMILGTAGGWLHQCMRSVRARLVV